MGTSRTKKGVIAIGSAVAIIAIVAGVWVGTGQQSSQPQSLEPKGEVFIMYAGSLPRTMETTIGPEFQKVTGYTYLGEGKGSVQIANMIIDKQRTPDVFISAGKIPIQKLMTNDPPLASWLISFASAEVVIAYTPNSPFFDDLEKARNGELLWYEVLAKDGLKFRRTDPELDPKGYYTIIVAQLANLHYNDPTIKDRILGEDRNAEQILPEETLKTTLEQGQIDAAVAYRHEAVARGLPYIVLPKEINLSDPTQTDFYEQASYTLGTGTVVPGGTIPFSVTIPETVQNNEGSVAFVKFLLSGKGMSLIERDGLAPTKFVADGNVETIPSAIRDVVG
ncbi:MAG: extracellular solute-binding protein [Nitrososphaerales archaeon]